MVDPKIIESILTTQQTAAALWDTLWTTYEATAEYQQACLNTHNTAFFSCYGTPLYLSYFKAQFATDLQLLNNNELLDIAPNEQINWHQFPDLINILNEFFSIFPEYMPMMERFQQIKQRLLPLDFSWIENTYFASLDNSIANLKRAELPLSVFTEHCFNLQSHFKNLHTNEINELIIIYKMQIGFVHVAQDDTYLPCFQHYLGDLLIEKCDEATREFLHQQMAELTISLLQPEIILPYQEENVSHLDLSQTVAKIRDLLQTNAQEILLPQLANLFAHFNQLRATAARQEFAVPLIYDLARLTSSYMP